MIWAIHTAVVITPSPSTPKPPKSLKTPPTTRTARITMTQSGTMSKGLMADSLCRFRSDCTRPGRDVAAQRLRLSSEVHFGDVFLVVLLGVGAEQQLDAGHETRRIEPNLRPFRIEAQQRQLGIVLAAFVPGGDEAVPQPVDHGAIVVERHGAMQGGEEIMALGGEGGDRPVAELELLHDGVVPRGEEPDVSLLAFDLGGHRTGVAVLDAVETQHHRPVRLEGGPELVFEFARRRHRAAPCIWKRGCRQRRHRSTV